MEHGDKGGGHLLSGLFVQCGALYFLRVKSREGGRELVRAGKRSQKRLNNKNKNQSRYYQNEANDGVSEGGHTVSHAGFRKPSFQLYCHANRISYKSPSARKQPASKTTLSRRCLRLACRSLCVTSGLRADDERARRSPVGIEM